jgi:hypothetical protein
VLERKRHSHGSNRFRHREWRFRALARFRKERIVADVTFVLLTIAFFAAAILYLRGCERLR